MSQPLQLSLGVQAAVNNQYLFSDHYLLNLLPQDPRWQAALPEAEAFLEWLQALYAHEQEQLASYNESQLEDHWIRPILERLGPRIRRATWTRRWRWARSRPGTVRWTRRSAATDR